MDNPPLYLAKSYHDQHLSQPLDPDEEVGNEELLYRRVIDKKYPYKANCSLKWCMRLACRLVFITLFTVKA